MKFNSKLMSAALFVILATPASGQESRLPSAEAGRVMSVEGPAGSVVVFRGAKAYALASGDVLFAGDRVLTRADGKAMLSASGCERKIDEASSITLNKDFCAATLVTIAEGGVVAAGIGTEAAAAASPNLAPLLSLGAGAGVANLVPVDGIFN